MAWQVEGNLKGPQGDPGIQGIQGLQGPPGEDGTGIELSGAVDAYADLPGSLGPGDVGTSYLVRADGLLYIWDGAAWPSIGQGVEFRGPKGDPGTAGAAATVAVGTVNTGAAGSGAQVTNSGTSEAAVFNFTIPRGDQGLQGIQGVPGEDGAPGTAATVAVGTVTTGAPGTSAAVQNVGTGTAAEFNFTIPRGDQGLQGIQGTPGADGTSWHFGAGAPGTIPGAIPGDAYLDTVDGTVYRLS